MKIILRNTTSRKDAAYVIRVVCPGTPDAILYGYWGSWATYQKQGLSGLRCQAKDNYPFCGQTASTLLAQKLNKGYYPVEMVDLLPGCTQQLRIHGFHTSIAPTPGFPVTSPSAPLRSVPDKPAPEPEPDPPRQRTRAAFLEL